MKKFRELSEAVKDKFDIGEYDQEGDMAKSDLRSILANAKRVHDMLEDSDNLPEWVQAKITKAEDYLSTVANYMEAEMNEEVELDEATIPTNTYRPRQNGRFVRRKFKGQTHERDPHGGGVLAKNKPPMSKEDVELDESLRHEIAGGVARFIGNKIDPVHGDIMHAHGKEAYRQAAYHIRKTVHHVSKAISDLHDNLHRHLRTGVPMKLGEDVEHLEEKNVPTSPEKWAQAKAQAKAKFDVYPSAYANGWAAKKYKEMGGGWKSVNEAKDDVPFKADKPTKRIATPGKYGVGYSTAKHLAKMGMQKQMQKMKKSVKEETMSKKAKIVKDIVKGKTEFSKNPELSDSVTRNL